MQVSNNLKEILLIFLSERVVSFNSNLKILPSEIKWKLNLRDLDILEAYKEGVVKGYINTMDKEKFIKENISVTLMLNINKIIKDNILHSYSKFKKIKEWYLKNKSYLSSVEDNITYIMDIESKGYTIISKNILIKLEALNKIIFNDNLKILDKKMFIKIISDIQLSLNKIKNNDLQYGKTLFTYNNFYRTAGLINKNFKEKMANPKTINIKTTNSEQPIKIIT